MSSEIIPTVKEVWRTHLRTSAAVHDAIKQEAYKEERTICYIVSRILETYYEEKKRLKVV